jgi:hypothetical protein
VNVREGDVFEGKLKANAGTRVRIVSLENATFGRVSIETLRADGTAVRQRTVTHGTFRESYRPVKP